MDTPTTTRLPVTDVLRMERVIGGDPVTEGLVLDYIGAQWTAKSLFYLPPKVARAVAMRPADFLKVVKGHYAPEFTF